MLKSKRGGIIGYILKGKIKAIKYGNNGGADYVPMSDVECQDLRERYGGAWIGEEKQYDYRPYLEERRQELEKMLGFSVPPPQAGTELDSSIEEEEELFIPFVGIPETWDELFSMGDIPLREYILHSRRLREKEKEGK